MSWPGAGRRRRRAEVWPSFLCENSSLLQEGEEGCGERPPHLYQGLPGMSFQLFLVSLLILPLWESQIFSSFVPFSFLSSLSCLFPLLLSTPPASLLFVCHFLEEQLGDLGKGNAMGSDMLVPGFESRLRPLGLSLVTSLNFPFSLYEMTVIVFSFQGLL